MLPDKIQVGGYLFTKYPDNYWIGSLSCLVVIGNCEQKMDGVVDIKGFITLAETRIEDFERLLCKTLLQKYSDLR